MDEKIKTQVLVKKQEKTTITKSKLKTKISHKETLVLAFMKEAKNTNKKCFMLSYNKPDNRSFSINDVLAELLKNSFVYSAQAVLTNSILFISDKNVVPIQNFIHEHFKELKFVLVRVNRKDYPRLRYCY